jgi:MFS family permease
VFAAIHVVCGSRRRATAIAIVLFAGTLLGGGLGPLATGALSDLFRSRYPVDGLRYALMITSGVLAPCSILFWIFGYAIPSDREV